MDAPECDKQEEDSRLERWLPPRKKLALQPSDGMCFRSNHFVDPVSCYNCNLLWIVKSGLIRN